MTEPAELDRQPVLTGDLIDLRPATEADYEALFAVASDPELWAQHPAHDRWQPAVFRRLFDQGMASGGMLVVRDRASGAVIGSSRYDFTRAGPGEVEVGWTFLARSHWGGRTNHELKRQMLDHAFAAVARVIFVIGEDNIRSRTAIERIGASLTDRRLAFEMAGETKHHVVYAIDREGYRL